MPNIMPLPSFLWGVGNAVLDRLSGGDLDAVRYAGGRAQEQGFQHTVIVLLTENNGISVFCGHVDYITIGDNLINKAKDVLAKSRDVCVSHRFTSHSDYNAYYSGHSVQCKEALQITKVIVMYRKIFSLFKSHSLCHNKGK